MLIKTKISVVDQEDPEQTIVAEAGKALRNGGIVSFPTETVYALGADAYNADTVAKIYRIKRRERTKPLSVFLRSAEDAQKVVDCASPEAQMLMEKFWPGPLTLVFKCTDPKLSLVLAKGEKLGIRVSPSQLVSRLLDEAGVPITATSANISGKKSCVAANRVFYFFNGRIDMILDGGRSKVFLPSTVLDVCQDQVSLIRQGHIPLDDIRKVVPEIKIPEDNGSGSDSQDAVEVGTIPQRDSIQGEQPAGGASS